MNYLESVLGEKPTVTEVAEVEQTASTESLQANDVSETQIESQAQPDQKQPSFSEDDIISRLTGGEVKSVDDFNKNYPTWKEASQRQPVDENAIMEKAYANTFVKELNQLVAKGATSEQIIMHVELSTLGDISNLDGIDAIARKISLEEGVPLAKAKRIAQLDVKTLEDFQEEHDEDMAEVMYEKYKIGQRKVENSAKEYLKTKQKDIYENVVKGDEVQLQAQEQSKALAGQWTANAAALKTTFVNAGVSKIEVKDENAGMDYSFEVKVPNEYIDTILAQVPQYAAQRGLELNEKNIEAISQEVYKSYISDNFKSIMEGAIRDTHAKAIKHEVERNSTPAKVGSPAVHQPSSKADTDPTHPSNFYRGR